MNLKPNLAEILEEKSADLLIEAISQAEEGNTPILMKLLDKILPNLNRSENLNVNLVQDVNDIVDSITKNIGIIESIETNKLMLNETPKQITQ